VSDIIVRDSNPLAFAEGDAVLKTAFPTMA